MWSTGFKDREWSCEKFDIKTDLIDNRLENLPAQKVSGHGQFSIDKSDRSVIWVIYIKASKVEHLVCSSEIEQR